MAAHVTHNVAHHAPHHAAHHASGDGLAQEAAEQEVYSIYNVNFHVHSDGHDDTHAILEEAEEERTMFEDGQGGDGNLKGSAESEEVLTQEAETNARTRFFMVVSASGSIVIVCALSVRRTMRRWGTDVLETSRRFSGSDRGRGRYRCRRRAHKAQQQRLSLFADEWKGARDSFVVHNQMNGYSNGYPSGRPILRVNSRQLV